MSTAVIWSKSKPDVDFQYGGRLGEFYGTLFQSHLPHCRVLPPGEFNVMIPELRVTLQGAATGRIQRHVIPEPHAILQGAVTWRNQCHDRATLQGVIIQSAILKIVFGHFIFLMQFWLWRAAAFVSSPIHSFNVCFSCLHTWARFTAAIAPLCSVSGKQTCSNSNFLWTHERVLMTSSCTRTPLATTNQCVRCLHRPLRFGCHLENR